MEPDAQRAAADYEQMAGAYAAESNPAPYLETVLLHDTWTNAGRAFQVRSYHRPLSR